MSSQINYGQCKKCGKRYTNRFNEWCKPCQINDLKNIINWTSGNEIIDNLIQEMQLKISSPLDKVFEWIPYNQFIDIKKIGENSFAKIYSAIWKDGPIGPLYYSG